MIMSLSNCDDHNRIAFKNPFNNNMMNDQIDNCLPPNSNTVTNTQRGYLKITPLQVTFFSNRNAKHMCKIQFWGSPQPNYLQLTTTQSFPIVSNLANFKLYLIDSKVTAIEVIDSRNYKAIGVAYLNWLLYLRSIDDKVLYRDQQNSVVQRQSGFFLPFIDEIMEDVFPLYKWAGNGKQKSSQKVGQIKLKWECRIFEETESRAATPPQLDSSENLYNIRVGQVGKESKFVSINEIDMIREESRPNHNINYDNQRRVSKMTQVNNSLLLGHEPKKGSPSNKEARISVFSKVSKVSKNYRDEGYRGPLESGLKYPDSNIKYSDSNLDAELVRIRMEMAEYVSEDNPNIAESIVKILSFQSSSRQVNVRQIAFLDVVTERNEIKIKYRVFPEIANNSHVTFNSSLAVQDKTNLLFTLGFKKSKDVQPRGQIKLETIGEAKEVSLFGSDGLLCGFLKVVVCAQKKQLTNITTEVKNTIQKEVPSERESQSNMKYVSEIRAFQQVLPKQKPSQNNQGFSQLYYLLLLQEPSDIVDSLSYEAFGRKIEGSTSKKFAIYSQREIAGRPLVVQIFNSNHLLIHSQKVLQRVKMSARQGENLTCALISKKLLELSKITCSLYSGSVDQLVFFVQELTHNILTQMRSALDPRKQYYQQYNMERLSSQGRQNTEEALMKLKTEEGAKLKTEEAVGLLQKERRMTQEREKQSQTVNELDIHLPQEHEMEGQRETSQQNQNFYLVDLLSRFLQQIQDRSLPEGSQIQKNVFLARYFKDKQSEFQSEVVDMILSIFQDETAAPVNLNLLRQSIKAFSTFFNLYSEQKNTVLKQILKTESKAIQKIKKHTEMSMINEKLLWGKALTNITNKDIREKVNKIYRISSFAPTQALLLIEDLQSITALASETPRLRSMDICNLGSLVKEWVEQYLTSLSVESIKRVKDKVIELADENSALLNIRSTNEVLESELGLRLSLWQSLMLIEEVKSAYICDMDAGEGLISGDSLGNWIESVINRQFQNHSLQESKVSQVIQELQGWGKGHHDHRLQNHSVRSKGGSKFDDSMVYKNNDSEIVDIANLLRQRQEEQERKMGRQNGDRDRVIESEKDLKEHNPNRDIPNEDIQKSSIKNKKGGQASSRKPPFRMFYLQVDSLSFFDKTKPSQSQLKLTITLGEEMQQKETTSFLYLTSSLNFSEGNGKTFEIKTGIYRNEALYLRLFSEQDMVGAAVLDWEEYNSWYSQSDGKMKKTLMIYGRKGVLIGKISLTLLRQDASKEDKEEQAKIQMLKLKIRQCIPHSTEPFHLEYTSGEVKQSLSLEVNKEYQIEVEKPVYSRQILVQNHSKDGSCIILLEQLYLKKLIKAQYPLVDVLTGTFKGTLTIQMAIQGYGLDQLQQGSQSPSKEEKKEVKSISKYPAKQRQKRESIGDKMLKLKGHDLMKQIDTLYNSLRSRYGELPKRQQPS